ncbi:aryl hydrocarbon receptor nuclear translocator-like protein 1 [Xenia sp. Carnegie-2017]|uniref:aryl hydrocarbon receptor nuclear translocator-like protein 1 n=1 Tax=Xenia sp. Carnegie-2017 TaxID=2897299 RepID=UPI001F035263|nr:aryl hydrocarbon receptor nuclear translocator-like protein 1 [Xenia sp. Carnegie-2017]
MGKIDDQEKCERGSKSNLNRESRNKSEKDRRDKVNAFINELANLVPGCVPQSKKLDKATILKNTVDFMKVHNDLTVAITRKDATSCLNSNEIGQLMLEGYNSFLFVISSSGHFKFISESIYDLLGYVKDDLFEKNIFDYVYPEDKLVLLNQVSQDKIGMTRNSGMSSFKIRFKANVHGKPCYEVLRCCGNFRLLDKGMKEMKVFSCMDNT